MKKAETIWPNMKKDLTPKGQAQLRRLVRTVGEIADSMTSEDFENLIDLLDSGQQSYVYDALCEAFKEEYPASSKRKFGNSIINSMISTLDSSLCDEQMRILKEALEEDSQELIQSLKNLVRDRDISDEEEEF
jgi:hypothetical protein